MTTTRYISVTDTAKLLRTALREAFPGVKFAVKSSKYSGGASITVVWTDGPVEKAVNAVCEHFRGADFDGMRDLKTYTEHTMNGDRVRFGADFIFTTRHYGAGLLELAIAETLAYWGDLGTLSRADLAIREWDTLGARVEDATPAARDLRHGGRWLSLGQLVMTTAQDMALDIYPEYSPTADSTRVI